MSNLDEDIRQQEEIQLLRREIELFRHKQRLDEEEEELNAAKKELDKKKKALDKKKGEIVQAKEEQDRAISIESEGAKKSNQTEGNNGDTSGSSIPEPLCQTELWKFGAYICSSEDEDDDETSPFRMFFPMDAVVESNASWKHRIEDWLDTSVQRNPLELDLDGIGSPFAIPEGEGTAQASTCLSLNVYRSTFPFEEQRRSMFISSSHQPCDHTERSLRGRNSNVMTNISSCKALIVFFSISSAKSVHCLCPNVFAQGIEQGVNINWKFWHILKSSLRLESSKRFATKTICRHRSDIVSERFLSLCGMFTIESRNAIVLENWLDDLLVCALLSITRIKSDRYKSADLFFRRRTKLRREERHNSSKYPNCTRECLEKGRHIFWELLESSSHHGTEGMFEMTWFARRLNKRSHFVQTIVFFKKLTGDMASCSRLSPIKVWPSFKGMIVSAICIMLMPKCSSCDSQLSAFSHPLWGNRNDFAQRYAAIATCLHSWLRQPDNLLFFILRSNECPLRTSIPQYQVSKSPFRFRLSSEKAENPTARGKWSHKCV